MYISTTCIEIPKSRPLLVLFHSLFMGVCAVGKKLKTEVMILKTNIIKNQYITHMDENI